MPKPLVDQLYVLQKFPGKGGWTYAAIPEVLQDKTVPFGWVKVRGSIDGYEIKHYNLMPMGNGQLFLPVKASIRKQIKKQEGDSVHIVLYADNQPIPMPDELRVCLQEEPAAFVFFQSLPQKEQQRFIKWIEDVATESKKVDRLAQTINLLCAKRILPS